MNRWPYPGDSRLARARRIAQAYRAHLEILAPETVAELDTRYIEWGESWIAPMVLTYALDDWLSARQAADVANVGMATIRQWRLRGILPGRRSEGGPGRWQWLYQARDVLSVISVTRKRGPGRRES